MKNSLSKRSHKRLPLVLSLFTLAIMLSFTMLSWQSSFLVYEEDSAFISSEFELAELSPNGENGGLAMPASGASGISGTASCDYENVWVAGWGAQCSTICAEWGYSQGQSSPVVQPTPSPEGTVCASGAVRPPSLLEQHGVAVFRYGCFGDSNCSATNSQVNANADEDYYGGYHPWHAFCSEPSFGPSFMYDSTIRTVACSCQRPVNLNCTPPPTATLEVKNVTQDTGWTGSNITIDPVDEIALRWTSENADSCSGSNFSTGAGNPTSGTQNDVNEPADNSERTYRVVCSNSTDSASDSLIVDTRFGTGSDIVVDPPLVRRNGDVRLIYDTGTSDPATCSIRAGAVVISNSLPSNTGSISVTVTGETTYELICPGGNSDATTVRILSELQET